MAAARAPPREVSGRDIEAVFRTEGGSFDADLCATVLPSVVRLVFADARIVTGLPIDSALGEAYTAAAAATEGVTEAALDDPEDGRVVERSVWYVARADMSTQKCVALLHTLAVRLGCRMVLAPSLNASAVPALGASRRCTRVD